MHCRLYYYNNKYTAIYFSPLLSQLIKFCAHKYSYFKPKTWLKNNIFSKIKILGATNAHPTANKSIDGFRGESCATCISPPFS